MVVEARGIEAQDQRQARDVIATRVIYYDQNGGGQKPRRSSPRGTFK